MNVYKNSPYKKIPTELLSEYTMNGKIPVLDLWLDGRQSLLKTKWDNNYINSYKNMFSLNKVRLNKSLKEPYKNASKMLLKAFIKYDIKNKNIAVIGSTSPWIEAILLNLNNNVTTVEYNVPDSECEIKCISYDFFKKDNYKYDCIVSYSSIEHSGLGRYGDELDPNGDIDCMNLIHKKLIKDGLLIWGAPVGSDALVWNAHRIYGKIRLPVLFSYYKELDWIEYNKEKLLKTVVDKRRFTQPVVVLQKLTKK